MKQINLKFGSVQIARNLNTYRMARPTEEFWSAWKTDKAELKSAGYSVFKRGEEFFVALYDGGKGTATDYLNQQEANFSAVKKEIAAEILGYDGRAYESDIDEALRIVDSAQTMSDFEELDGLLCNWQRVVEEAEDAVFSAYFDGEEEEQGEAQEQEQTTIENIATPYIIRDREAGNLIDGFTTLEEARKALARYEREDEENGTFSEGFYEIAERNENGEYNGIE